MSELDLPTTPPSHRRRRLTPLALVTGVVGAVILAFSMNGSLAAFTAAITNTVNTAAQGTLIMQEKNGAGTVTCTSTDGAGNSNVGANAATCATINKYGGSTTLVPGQTATETVTITNTGTAPANSFTLAAGTCTQSGNVTGSATDLCSQLGLVITQTPAGGTQSTVTTANSTLASVAGKTLALAAPVAAGSSVSLTFAVTLPTASGNSYQGLAAAQPLTWTFTS